MSDGKVKVQVILERKSDEHLCQVQFMGSHLICGTIHNDKLLMDQPINLKSFTSPYTVCFCLLLWIDRSVI